MRALALWLILLAQVASAAPKAPSDEVVNEARRRFQRANQLYQDGRYTDALHLYQAAYDLVPSPDILFNLGLVKEKVFDYEGCSLALRDYLRQGDSAHREQAETRLEQCRARTLIPLRVSSLPTSASVSVGEGSQRTSHGRTPTRLDLRPGTYTVTVEAPGFVPQSQTVTLEEGVHPDIDFTLEKLSTLRIEADVSGATIFVDDEPQGESPVQREIKAGLHRVRVEKEGYRSVTREMSVHAGDQLSLVLSLPALPRERRLALGLAHDGRGTAARVELDGAELGTTPLERTVAAGQHRLQIERAGSVTFDRDLMVPDDRDLRLRVHLQPRRTRAQQATFWTLQSIASAAATAGVVFGALALVDHANFDAHPSLALGQAGQDKATACNVLFGVSAAIGIAGAIYYLVTWPRSAHLEVVR
jgi:hypothetical protein